MSKLIDPYQYACPDADTIQKFMNGSLPASAHLTVEAHVQQCEFCKEAIEGLQFMNENNLEEINSGFHSAIDEKLNPQLSQKKDNTFLRIAASVVILLATSFTLFFLLKDNNKQEAAIAQVNPSEKKEQTLQEPASAEIKENFRTITEEDEKSERAKEPDVIKSLNSIRNENIGDTISVPVREDSKYKAEANLDDALAKDEESVKTDSRKNENAEMATTPKVAESKKSELDFSYSDKVTPTTTTTAGNVSSQEEDYILEKTNANSKKKKEMSSAEAKKHWKKANEFLNKKDTTACIKELQRLIITENIFSAKADSLLKRIR